MRFNNSDGGSLAQRLRGLQLGLQFGFDVVDDEAGPLHRG